MSPSGNTEHQLSTMDAGSNLSRLQTDGPLSTKLPALLGTTSDRRIVLLSQLSRSLIWGRFNRVMNISIGKLRRNWSIGDQLRRKIVVASFPLLDGSTSGE